MFQLYNVYMQPTWFVMGLITVGLWEMVWKGIALWFAGNNKQKGWFIALLVVNSLGLLPMMYLLWFKPKEKRETKLISTRTKKKK